MKSIGITRRIDDVGRIVLPKELRESFDLQDNKDSVEIFVEGDRIILKKYMPSCLFCGSSEKLIELSGHKVCSECLGVLNSISAIQNK